MAKKEPALTYEMVITNLMQHADGPVPAQELASQMLSMLPSTARNPQQAMRQHIRQANGKQLIFLDSDTVLPVRLAFQGARFRIPLERESFNQGVLPINRGIRAYLPMHFDLSKLQLVDATGRAIPAQIQVLGYTFTSLFNSLAETAATIRLGAWYRTQKVYIKDHLLFTILDWDKGVLRLEHEPYGQIEQARLDERNQLLSNMFYNLLESAVKEDVIVHAAVPTIYAHLPEKSGYPAGSWWDVLAADGRMKSDGFMIHYREHETPYERMLEKSRKIERKPRALQPVSKLETTQVYRFRAQLAYQPKIWRVIEVQGKHTLSDLDIALRDAFNHDVFDHMGGFWKLIPRAAQAKTMAKRSSGKASRYREVDIGTVEPMGGGEGSATKIAGLELNVSDQLKYVYDFGDWIEHRLTLEAIEAPQSKGKYPREVARNQPEYVYCLECQKKGKQTVAKWVCLSCTKGPEKETWLCEKCANKHEDHYLEEILY